MAIAAVGSTLQIVQDFTADREVLSAALDRFAAGDSLGFQDGTAPTGEETEADGFVADDTEFNIFNTDRRLAAIEQLSDTLAPIQQKKSIVYFSSGMTQRGEDNQVQLRAAIDRAVKANVSIYPVDTRGLTAIVPGGAASQASGRGGSSMFSGRGVSRQFDSQSASQDTLVALASDTGGKAFLDTNDFGGVYTKVIADTSAYYLLGYSSTNPGSRRTFPADQGTAQQAGPQARHQARASQRVLREPRLPALGQGGSRASAAGPADDGSLVHRPDGLDVGVVLPLLGRPVLRAGVDCGAGIGDPVCRSRARRTGRRSTSSG